MTLFQNVPLQRKLTWLTMICCLVALLTTTVALGMYEWWRLGTLSVRPDVSQIREQLGDYLTLLLATTAASALLALLLAVWLTKRLVAPVQALVTAASVVKSNETELEAHVKARTRELEAANQELESFAYSVSHDLRGPVRAILGFSEIALEDCQAGKPEAAVERLQRVIRAAERMNKLIDAFIGMARISRAEPVFETVNLSRLADEVVGFLRAAAPVPRAIEVVVAAGLECEGDERLLRIVLENLIGNAWKFTARQQNPRIEFGVIAENGERVFFVRDNGAGFNAALGYKLFRAFERLHDASQFEGLGVGLNTVHRVIEKHAGRVWAEGREGNGATFYFTIGVRVGSATNRDHARVVAAAGR